jgi:hypothetical protein
MEMQPCASRLQHRGGSFTTVGNDFEMNDIRPAPAAEVEFQRSSQTGADQHLARLIAFYLPQFHPIPENDAWWGPGFTEWTNVAKARPLYKDHKQPRLPGDLGFYDLRLPETRERQADMARDAGIEGFCYWHYWFGEGRRILERVFDEVLASGKPNYPFCLAWANQSWSGVWHGMPKHILIEQKYPGPADFHAHFRAILPAFRDPRYMTVGGKPIFIVFSALDLPDTKEFTHLWNELALKAGLPGVYFIGMSNRHDDEILQPFDMLTEFGPISLVNKLPRDFRSRAVRSWRRRDFGPLVNRIVPASIRRPLRFEYRDLIEAKMRAPLREKYVTCVLPNFDNTPRSGQRGVVFDNATPELFEIYLKDAIDQVLHKPYQERIVFLQAWNEWAEGNYLEPDRETGWAYLDAIRRLVVQPT